LEIEIEEEEDLKPLSVESISFGDISEDVHAPTFAIF
jgi:hypothetical protein